MGNQYALTPTQTVTAPNGIKITIYTDGNKRFVKLRSVYNSLGYPRSWGNNSLFAMAFKSGNIAYYNKYITGGASYVIEIKDVVPLLEKFCRLTLTIKSNGTLYDEIRDNARMEAERLIEVFNTEVFGKTPVAVTKINAPTVEAVETTEKVALPAFKPIATIEGVPPYDKTIGIYVRDGETFILVEALAAALYGYCDDDASPDFDEAVADYAFETVLKAANSSGVPETDTDNGDINTRNVLGTLDKFYEVEPRESIADNAIPVKDFLREYEYFQPPAPVNDEQEDTQMQDSATNQATVPTVTVADIEDIGERTEAVMKIFGVSKVDALRAVTQLKAQEINRELQPLLELLDGQKK